MSSDVNKDDVKNVLELLNKESLELPQNFIDIGYISQTISVPEEEVIRIANFLKRNNLIESRYTGTTIFSMRIKNEGIEYLQRLNGNNKKFFENKKHVNRKNHLVVYPIIGWMVFGIIMATLNYAGMFIVTHNEEIDITKKYQVVYESWKDENTLSGLYDGMSLSGKIILQSTQFSAQNKIDVHIELSPNTGSDIKDVMRLDSIAPPFNVYFVGAQHFDIENNKPLADILLKRSSDGTKLIGDGSIIYSKGDYHEIYVLDSSENALKQEFLTVNDSPNSIILFPIEEKTLNLNGYFDEEGNELIIPTRVELTSTTEPYLIEIKQSDAQNALGSDKMNAFFIWMTLAFLPLTIIPALRYFPINKPVKI